MNGKLEIACPSSPWVSYYVPSRAYNGYTLYTPGGGSVAWLIDMQGHPVHCWDLPYGAAGAGELLPNGNLLQDCRDFSGMKTKPGSTEWVLLELDWDGNIVWKYTLPYSRHQFDRMDNGNTMVSRQVDVPADIAARVKGGLPGTEGQKMVTEAFQEVTPDGNVVWEWLAYEHLDTEIDIMCPICTRHNWTHINSCFILPDGDVMTTLHHLDTVAIIDKKSGDVKWRWGKGIVAHPHNPTLLDNGNILLWDNGQHRQAVVTNFSRILEVNPDTGGIVWEYKDNPPHRFYSSVSSGAQRLPNGNTFICELSRGRFFEVTRDKEKVWEFYNPFYFKDDRPTGLGLSNRVSRAYRYGPDYPGLKGRELNPDCVELTLRERPQGIERAALPPRG